MPSNFWTDPATKPLIVAHRGGAALAAENTLAAFQATATAGADAIETDVRMTRDGALVCLHDADLQRLCGDPRAVAELDLTILQGLLPTVMTLDAALAASAPTGLLLDVKLTDRTSLAEIVDRVERGKAVERTLLGLRSLDLVAVARSARTDIASSPFSRTRNQSRPQERPVRTGSGCGRELRAQPGRLPCATPGCTLRSWSVSRARCRCRNIRPFPSA